MTKSSVGLMGIGGYLPSHIMPNEAWAEYVDTSDEWITTRTGIKRRRIADCEESTADLATSAAKSALEDAGLGPQDVDEIVVATDTPEVYTPDTASYVQHRLGTRNVPAYDLGGSGCAGFLQAMDIAHSRAQGTDRKILVIGAELLSRLVNWHDRNTCVLFGDGAAAAIVTEGEGLPQILAAKAGTDGSKADILCLECGGTRKPFNLKNAQEGEHQKLVMNGREVFKEAVHHMSKVSQEVLELAGKTLDEVALVIPHQANLRILEAVRQNLDLPTERLFTNVQEYGNTGSASVGIALWEARAQGRIQPGDLILLTSFGAGFHWAAVLIQF